MKCPHPKCDGELRHHNIKGQLFAIDGKAEGKRIIHVELTSDFWIKSYCPLCKEPWMTLEECQEVDKVLEKQVAEKKNET